MKTDPGPEQGTAINWEGSLDLSAPLFGRRVGLVVQWRGRAVRRVLYGLVLLFVVGMAFDFRFWLVLTHSVAYSAPLTAATTMANLVVIALLGHVIAKRKWVERTFAWFSAFPAHGLTDLAVFLAGRKRPALRAEWQAHLAGESGHDPVTWRKAKDALGFVASAVQYRLGDAADAAWTPTEAILKSRKLSNLLVFGPTAMAAWYILRHLGTLGVLVSAEGISAIGGGLYGLVRVGRWWRDVKPPEPKARRVKEQ